MLNYNLKVSELIELSPTAKAVRLDLDGNKFPFQPGQFIMMELDLEATGKFKVKDDKKTIQKRPFSMSSTPLQTDYLEVTVKTTEDPFFSDYLVNYLTSGEEITVTGPYGHFFLDETSKKNIVLIGAGSGISPLMAMFRHVKEAQLRIKAHLIFSNRTQNEILWKKDIESSKSDNLSHEFTITREDWDGTQGRINKEIIERTPFPLTEVDFYICGPSEFAKNMESLLLELDIPKENIKKEAY